MAVDGRDIFPGTVPGSALNIEPKSSVRLATTAALVAPYTLTHTAAGRCLTSNANADFGSIDGLAVVAGDEILLKDEGGASPATDLHNGIYVVTDIGLSGLAGHPWVLTRRSDANSSAGFDGGGIFGPGVNLFVRAGHTNAGLGFLCLGADPYTIDTTPVGFTLTSAGSNNVVKDMKDACIAATVAPLAANTRTGNVLTETGFGSISPIDGVAITAGKRILVKDEAASENDGIYTVTVVGTGGTSWVLTRATDADTDALVTQGMGTIIIGGTQNAEKCFVLTTPDVISLNTTPLTFAPLAGAAMTIAQLLALIATANAPVNINSQKLTGALGIGLVASAPGALGDVGMDIATGRPLFYVGGAASSAAVLGDIAPGQSVEGLRPVADAAALDPTPDTIFFVNTSGAPLTINSANLISNGAFTAVGVAPGDLAHVLLRKFTSAGVGSTISTISPAATPADDWVAGQTVPFPAFAPVTLSAGEMLGYQITKDVNGTAVPSFLIAAVTGYLPVMLPQGLKPIADATEADVTPKTIFWVNTTGAPIVINAAELIPNGALGAALNRDTDYATITLYSHNGAGYTSQGVLTTKTSGGSGGTGDWTAGVGILFPLAGGLTGAPVTLAPGDGLAYEVGKTGVAKVITPSFLVAITS